MNPRPPVPGHSLLAPGQVQTPPLVPQQYYISSLPYSPESDAAAESNEGLLEYGRLLMRHKKAIFFSAVGGLVLGLAIGAPMTPVYRAHISLEILGENQNFMNMKQASPTTTSDFSDDVSEEETQSQMIQGGALMERVSHVLDPDSASATGQKMASYGWRSWFNLPAAIEPTKRQLLVAKAVKTLKVRVVPHTRLLDITADSTSPSFAATFVNTLVQEFIKRNIELRYSANEKTGEWLTREISGAKDNLRKSEDALQAYARNSGLIFTDNEQETNVATEKLQQLQQSLSAATNDRTGKQAKFELARNVPVESLGDVLNDENLQELSSKIDQVSEQLADLNSVYSPEYVKVQRTKAQLDSLKASFDQKRELALQRIENDYHLASENEKLINAAYVAQEREVTGQDEKTIQYHILKREVDSNRQLYDTMLLQMKQASIASALHASNVRVSDPAATPSVPVLPNHKLDAILGTLAGILACVGIVTMLERADRTLKMPGDIKQRVGLAELGTIPSSKRGLKKSAYRPRDVKTIRALASQTPESVALATFQQKSSLIAEAFRSCLTSILFVGEAESIPKVLLFTSTQAGDGKTTVVANLGIALSEIRTKTLIIDADMRRPTMERVFGLRNNRGLCDLLQSDLAQEDAATFILPTNVAGLHLLPAGSPSSAASHLLHSPNFLTLLNKVRQEYDMILIDSPPMIQMTDARVVGRLSDAAVLVARAGVTSRDALLAAKERFEQDHTPILGAILNYWDVSRSTGSYYYQQDKHYRATYDVVVPSRD